MATLMIGMGGGGRNKGAPSMPPPEGPSKMPKDSMAKDPAEPDGDEAGKMSPEKALVIKADEHCGSCKNYEPTSGACSKVVGVYEMDDACFANFSPMGGAEEPDADDMGGPSDMDADNAPPPGAMK